MGQKAGGTPNITSTPPSRGRPSTSRLVKSSHSAAAQSWKSSNVRHIAQQVVEPLIKQASGLIHAYMVCGLTRDPTEWLIAPKPTTGRAQRTTGGVGSFLSPQILGSIPQHERDEDTVQMFAAALKATFPNDCEISIGGKPPGSTCHSFVLQMNPSRSLYGVALRLWVRSDAARLPKMAKILETSELENMNPSIGAWIPYCLAVMSHYPLFDLMSDYLRCSWMLWSKDPDKFNNDGVLRLIKLPPPKPDQFLRIPLEKYTLCYHIPSLSQDFQNFSLWPLFSCLCPKHVVALLEAALSPSGQIILTSHHTAVLTIVAEAIRYYIGSWAGLYVPVGYGRYAQELIDEPAPYMLGFTKASKPLFNPPKDALVVDLDFDRIFTAQPPGSLSPRQRTKYAALLTQALGEAAVEGVPIHLRSAYDQNVRFSAFGSTLSENSTLSIKEPGWWDHNRVRAAMSRVCDGVRRNYKLLAVWKSVTQSTKVRTQDLAEIIHHRNHLARSLDEAWRECINNKHRSDIRNITHQKSIASLNTDLEKRTKDFEELSECTEQLIEETRSMQSVINQRSRDITHITSQLNDKTTHAKQMSNYAAELQGEVASATKTLEAQQALLDEMKRSRSEDVLSQERDDAQRAVIHLTSLISGQVASIERVMASLLSQTRPNSQTDQNRKDSARRSYTRSPSPQISPAPFSTPAALKRMPSRRNTGTVDHASSNNNNDKSNKRFSQLISESDTFDEKIRIVTDTVRKINNQCFQAIEDLASRRETKGGEESSSSTAEISDGELPAFLSRTPELDSRADTRQSGSLADVQEVEDGRDAVWVQSIIEEMDSEVEGEQFVDAAQVVEKKDGPQTLESMGLKNENLVTG